MKKQGTAVTFNFACRDISFSPMPHRAPAPYDGNDRRSKRDVCNNKQPRKALCAKNFTADGCTSRQNEISL